MNVYQRLILLVGSMSFGIVVFNYGFFESGGIVATRQVIAKGIAILGATIMLWFAAKNK